MAYQFTTISENDWGNGIDQQSAENAIKPGFVEDLINGDPKAEGYVAKRVGYQGVAGNIPVRVSRVDYTGTNLCFTLDTSLNLARVASTPLYVKGRLSVTSGGGDFDAGADSTKYYTKFTLDNTINLPSSSNTLSILADDHGQGTANFLPRLYAKGITENSLFHVDSISINKLTTDLTIGYTYSPGVGDPSDITAYIVYSNRSTNAYIAPSTTSVTAGSTATITVGAGTHAQSISNNLLVELWQDDGTNLILIKPDAITVSTTGTVVVTLTNNSGSTIQVFPVITAVGEAQTKTSSLDYTNRQLVITNLQSDFVGISIYTKNATNGLLSEIIPDSITINPVTRTLTAEFGFDNIDYANAIVANGESTFVAYYENLTLLSNKLCVTAGIAAVGTVIDQEPQLTIWGLDHSEIYGSNPTASRSGWVTHIDSYKAPAVNTVVAGLGGNIFAVNPVSPAITLYPNINSRVAPSANRSIGPAFYGLTNTPDRTVGYCKFSGGEENWARVTAVTWITNNTVEYTLSTPGRTNTGTPISYTKDRLTVEGCGWAVNNGNFALASAPNYSNSDEIKIRVTNTQRDSADFDETDSGGLGGIFTDTITLAASSPFIANDRLISDLFNEATDIRVVESTGTSLTIGNLVDSYTIPSTLLIVAERQGRVLPLRTRSGAATVANVVAGDMCIYNNLNRLLRVKRVNADSNRTVSLSGDGTTLTVTLGTGTTAHLNIGQYILLRNNEIWNGEHQVLEILNDTQFTISSAITGTASSVILVGNTVELDEAVTLVDDRNNDITFSIPYRWQPVEAPSNIGDITKKTYTSHFPAGGYGEQEILRSTMSASNMYLTNGEDQVMKFDGVNIYRAGLPRWQPQLFISTDTTATEKIALDLPQVTTTASESLGSYIRVKLGEESTYKVGATLFYANDSKYYTVTGTDKDTSHGYIKVSPTPPAVNTNSTVKLVAVYRYYFRLNLTDNNNNTIASAVTGADDNLVRLTASAKVRLKLVGFPAWDNYDYDKLELQIYRTQLNSVAPFYRVASFPIEFTARDGYILFDDTQPDSGLTVNDVDKVASVLEGAELGTQWSGPLRSKYITSAANRLVLANIKTDPQLDIQLTRIKNGSDISIATLTSKRFLFRKDNTDVGTTTDNVNRIAYQFVSSGATTIVPNTAITVTSTSFTVAASGHGLQVGNWVYLFHSNVADAHKLDFCGWWQVNSVVAGTSFTVLANDLSAATVNDVDRFVTASTKSDVPIWLGTDGNYGQYNGNQDTAVIPSYELTAMRRFANAINATMRQVDTSLTAYSTFTPWMIANAGNEYAAGQLVITQPKSINTTLEVRLPDSFSSQFNIFVNNILRKSTNETTKQVSAYSTVYNSRLLISYTNYPELFNDPTNPIDRNSSGTIDVNSADGQEITGVIPFFGESAFGAALRSGVVVVFKTHSIYVVDLAEKAAGRNPVQKVESQGLGCTAPYSIANTKDGIIFANESGIYKLTRQLAVEYVGRKVERVWRNRVTSDALQLAFGHHYGTGSQYKISVPLDGGTSPGDIFVYSHVREYQGGIGAWSRYSHSPTIGWCNLQSNAYFASTNGRVYSIRKAGDNTDYRDDDQPIEFSITMRANDFGDGGIRKIIQYVIAKFRVLGDASGTVLATAADLNDNFVSADSFRIDSPADNTDGLSDANNIKVQTIRFSIDNRKLVFLQIRITNSSIDEPVEIAEISVRVSGMTDKGITSAART